VYDSVTSYRGQTTKYCICKISLNVIGLAQDTHTLDRLLETDHIKLAGKNETTHRNRIQTLKLVLASLI